MSDDDPQFGYGAGGRPLWTVRDRDAEVIRTVLRKAGSREFSERHGGFVVEGGQDGAPFAIACADDAASRCGNWPVMRRRCARPATDSRVIPMMIRRCWRGRPGDSMRSS
ncbi:hypothetical protein [Streptosporangium roseum]|uniref:hypothetical protein n=1 Tax=Streptosporangium roseum TaxID=2001 RepID=UPI0012DCF1C1|nr:hypothetical protein [Streptosporangium roseum]